MDDYEKEVRLSRLVEYGRTFHKRFGVFSFNGNSGLNRAEFVDVNPFDNSSIFQHLQGSPLLHLSMTNKFGNVALTPKHPQELSSVFFNGHLLCDWNEPWRPRAATPLITMMSHIAGLGNAHIIVNPRDFPWCKKDHSVPWTFLKVWLPSKFFQVPMQRPLSFYGGPEWTDILMPLPEHWRVWEETEGLRSIPRLAEAPIGVFRGSLTGRYLDERNVRIRLCMKSHEHPGLFDASLSGWSNRIRVRGLVEGVLHAQDPPPADDRLLGDPMDKEQQCAYRVIVYAPGHVASSRLAWNLCSGSAVLMVNDPSCLAPDMWFTTTDFDTRVARFVDGKFITTPSTIAFACDAEDVLRALDTLRLDPQLLGSVTRQCLEWSSKTFAFAAVRMALQKACEMAASV